MLQSENHNSISITQWKSQLDFDRPCGAVSSDETCWLCGDFMAWNSVIQAFDLELAETRPGTMRLQSVSKEPLDRHPVVIAQETARLASLLSSHHSCIQELSLVCSIRARSPFERPPFPIHLSPASSTPVHRMLRLLCITERASTHLDLRDMHVITGLETLIIRCEGHNQRIADEIDALIERNRHTLKNFDIWEFGQRRKGLAMLESLVACDSLTLKSNFNNGGTPYMYGLASLMRVSTTLREVFAQPVCDREISLMAEALKTNCTLTKLSLSIATYYSTEELFGALELNKILKEFFLMKHVILDDGEVMGHWSEALSKNCTLEFLGVHCEHVAVSQVSGLCKALHINKTLKTLKLQGVSGTEEQRESLARQLLEDECYDRVQMEPWADPYLRILSPVLVSSQSATKELWLPDVSQLSLEIVSVLFNALASNKKVECLTVSVKCDPDQRVALLCEMLKKNRSIEYLTIDIQIESSANEILRALTMNARVSHLRINLLITPVEETVAAFTGMFLRNNAITNISGDIWVTDRRRFIEALAEGLSGNRLIVDWSCVALGGGTECPPSVFGSVLRNRASLNRAIEFVLQRRVNRQCAECFELFFGRSCLTKKLVEVTGMSEAEARIGVDTAENRRQERYLTLTGVVRRSVHCLPADVTQIDTLNADCWRAIARYLLKIVRMMGVVQGG
ncbi:hypothetical protein HPB52_000437 [Rhipicephalus sanguineus]|uniref:Uncharacterized protein n=1 Tax=Rhipicephalus sanguineus TaxID=34632 RepID=A0A9D4PEX3_RHISA|nr:hypothetical protein HPB52_000437 [Rhipicephalus sanguineus]